jgi:hypothetical protein
MLYKIKAIITHFHGEKPSSESVKTLVVKEDDIKYIQEKHGKYYNIYLNEYLELYHMNLGSGGIGEIKINSLDDIELLK